MEVTWSLLLEAVMKSIQASREGNTAPLLSRGEPEAVCVKSMKPKENVGAAIFVKYNLLLCSGHPRQTVISDPGESHAANHIAASVP